MCVRAAGAAQDHAATRAHLNWPHAPFGVPADIASALGTPAEPARAKPNGLERFAATTAPLTGQKPAEFARRMRG